jgi:hypothetical protein
VNSVMMVIRVYADKLANTARSPEAPEIMDEAARIASYTDDIAIHIHDEGMRAI